MTIDTYAKCQICCDNISKSVQKVFFLSNLINVLDPLRIWTSLRLQFGIILELVTVHTIFKPIEKLIYRCWPMFVSFWITFSSFVVNYMRIVRSTLVNEYDSSRLGQAQKRQRCHACVSVTVKHIMYAKNAYVVTFFSCFKCDDIVGLCDFFWNVPLIVHTNSFWIKNLTCFLRKWRHI